MKKYNKCEVQYFCCEFDRKSCKFFKASKDHDDCEYMERCYCDSHEAQNEAIRQNREVACKW